MTTSTKTKIDEVTVFNSFVLVHRTGIFTLPGDRDETSTDGVWTFAISDLPLFLEDATIRIRLEEDQKWVLRDVRIKIIRSAEKEQEADIFRSELERAERRLEEIKIRRYNQLKIIQEVEQWIDEPFPEPPVKDGRKQEKPAFPDENYHRYIDDLTDVLKKEMQKLRKIEQQIVQHEREYRSKIAMAEYQESRWSDDPGKRWKKQVIVKISRFGSEFAGGDIPFTFSYCIGSARWAPVYSIDMSADGARLDMKVNVAQRTGEDWHGVKIKFSAASIHRATQLPELPSRRIGRYQLPRPKKVTVNV